MWGKHQTGLDNQGKRPRQAAGHHQTHLCKYGYPPDMELLTTDRVMEQAQLIADKLALTA